MRDKAEDRLLLDILILQGYLKHTSLVQKVKQRILAQTLFLFTNYKDYHQLRAIFCKFYVTKKSPPRYLNQQVNLV